MAQRSRFRIFDLVVAVAASGVGLGGGVLLGRSRNGPDRLELIFWLVFAGYTVVAYYATRFVRSRGARSIILGIALAFASAALAMYHEVTPIFQRDPLSIVGVTGGLTLAALMLIAAGAIHNLLDHRHELKHPLPPGPELASPAHPLDRSPFP
jgi:hypothetical protein